MTQISGVGYTYLTNGFSVCYTTDENTRYFDPSARVFKTSGGWSKDSWLNLTNSFRLTFIYD